MHTRAELLVLYYIYMHSRHIIHSGVGWRLTLLSQSKKVPRPNPSRVLSVWHLHVLPVFGWVFSNFQGPKTYMFGCLVNLNCPKERVGDCVVVCLICFYGALWCTGDISRVYPASSPDGGWERLQPPHHPEQDEMDKEMDECIALYHKV